MGGVASSVPVTARYSKNIHHNNILCILIQNKGKQKKKENKLNNVEKAPYGSKRYYGFTNCIIDDGDVKQGLKKRVD